MGIKAGQVRGGGANVVKLKNGGAIVFDWSAFNTLRRSAEVKELIKSESEEMAARAGEGFTTGTKDYESRAVGIVGTGDYESRRAEATGKALTMAVRK